MPLLPTLLAHRDKILAIAKKHGIKDVRVFGSVARGEDGPDSDVDLLIDIVEPVEEPFGCVRFQREVEALLGRSVDIVFDGYIFTPLQEKIYRESKPL